MLLVQLRELELLLLNFELLVHHELLSLDQSSFLAEELELVLVVVLLGDKDALDERVEDFLSIRL